MNIDDYYESICQEDKTHWTHILIGVREYSPR